MSEIQIIMVAVTLFLIYKVYERVQNLGPEGEESAGGHKPRTFGGDTGTGGGCRL